LSGSLPIAGWLLGPEFGAAMLVFQQLFGDRIDEGSQIRYRLTGSWEEPDIQKLAPEAPDVAAAPDQ